LKLFNFLIILIFTTSFGCSFVPKQKAGSDALAEAICLYDKKIEYGSDNFSECLKNEQQ
jgi:hypothetical protein